MSSTFQDTEDKMDSFICGENGKNLKYSAAAAGAAVAYFGLGRTIRALPTEAHYGLAGLLVGTHCTTGFTSLPTMDDLMSPKSMSSIVYGIGGGLAFQFIRPRLGI